MKADAEDVNSEAKLIMARIIARRIATDPSVVDRAKAWYADWSEEQRATKPASYWIEVLEHGPEAARRRLTARNERAAWMRNSTPLVLSEGLDCLRDVEFRRRIWRDAKRLVALRMRRDHEKAVQRLDAALEKAAGQMRIDPDPEDYDDAVITDDGVERRAALKAYSEGRLSRDNAIQQLGLRDYAELLVALGDADLPMPLPPDDEIER